MSGCRSFAVVNGKRLWAPGDRGPLQMQCLCSLPPISNRNGDGLDFSPYHALS
jgi:hypothetical protein